MEEVKESYLEKNGYVRVSNLLIDNQAKLNITDGELSFLLKIMREKPGKIIQDKDIDLQICNRSMQRRRASLIKKGIFTCEIIRERNESGQYVTGGIKYNLEPLGKLLQKLSDELDQKKTEENKKYFEPKDDVVYAEDELVELTEEAGIEYTPPIPEIEKDEFLQVYKEEFEDEYGVEYKITSDEMELYTHLSEEKRKALSWTFTYCRAKNLLGRVVPRLSLFLKTPWRMKSLVDWCKEENIINAIEQIEKADIDTFLTRRATTKEWINKYYDICFPSDPERKNKKNIKEMRNFIYPRIDGYGRMRGNLDYDLREHFKGR